MNKRDILSCRLFPAIVVFILAACAAGRAFADPLAPGAGSPPPTSAPDTTASKWFQTVDKAQAGQPHWMTPLVTVTPRLEEEFRYDQYQESLGNGAAISNFDSGKGLELIPTTTNEVIINAPPYEQRAGKEDAEGFGDWPFLLIKQRLVSENDKHGNYIVTAFFSAQAPIGIPAFTNKAWVLTPTIAAGKGWGQADVQATVGAPVPLEHENTIGTSVTGNVAFQYHLGQVFWPEFEVNSTYWADGERKDKTQVFVTPGLILGRFHLGGRFKGIIGAGYQQAVAPAQIASPLTPTYNHAWIMTARVAF